MTLHWEGIALVGLLVAGAVAASIWSGDGQLVALLVGLAGGFIAKFGAVGKK